MNTKIGYYPILDVLLALRQMYEEERFQPFSEAMSSISNKMGKSEKEFLITIGDKTNGWLDIIDAFIKLTGKGMISPEELLVTLKKDCSLIGCEKLEDSDKKELSRFLMNMWVNFFNSDIAKNSRRTFEKVVEISRKIDEIGEWEYLINISDRIRKIEEGKFEILIKPAHTLNTQDLGTVIIMPSVFAVRRLTFWKNGLDYVFYISSELQKDENIEPSDMLLLKTLALNDKTRLKMLKILSSGNYNVGDMAERLNINSSTASRHFKVFKDAGFVDVFSQDGNAVYYSINKNEIRKSLDMILDYIEVKGEN